MTPSKSARSQTALPEELAAVAGAQVVTAELFLEQLVAMDGADAGLDLALRRIAAAALTHGLERSNLR